MLSIVLLMIQDIIMLFILQPDCNRVLATMFEISAISFSLSASSAGDKCIAKKNLRWVGTETGLRL